MQEHKGRILSLPISIDIFINSLFYPYPNAIFDSNIAFQEEGENTFLKSYRFSTLYVDYFVIFNPNCIRVFSHSFSFSFIIKLKLNSNQEENN